MVRLAGAVLLLTVTALGVTAASSAGSTDAPPSLLGATPSRPVTERFRPGHGLGAGPLHAWGSGPLRAFDGAHGWGLQFTMESHLTDRLVWDMRLGGFYTPLQEPEEIYYPPDDGNWSILSMALRVEVPRAGKAVWWVGPEVSLHYAQMKQFDYVGSGLGVGPVAGVDLPAWNDRVVFRLGAHLARVRLETDYDDVSASTTVAMVSTDLIYRFRRRGV